MTQRPALGRGLFYTRDSEGHSELAPPQYVDWARADAARMGVAFTGTPEAIRSMIARCVSAEGDLFLDYGVSGHHLSRPGLDAFRDRALADQTVTHLFVPRRDRIARPDNPLDAVALEFGLRGAGLTLVLMDKVLPPLPPGHRIELADVITCLADYDASGKFRLDLARKLILAKIRLAREGFSIGGEPVYGFRRWLCTADGVPRRELAAHEIVKMPGHHVVWLPTATRELEVVKRILDLIESTPAARIARMLNEEGIPSPMAGRTRKFRGVQVEISGQWTQNTIRNIARHPLLIAVWEYGRRSEGDQLRFTPDGPRMLNPGDYGSDKKDYRSDRKPKTVINPIENVISTRAKFDPLITTERRDKILGVLEERGKHLKGKARTRGDAPNPLGGRVYDLNCGWLMYRYARRGRWCYTCGLYQNSEAKCCRHNVVGGAAATRFVLACLRQRLLTPTARAKLEVRLRELATAQQGDDPARRQLDTDKAELAVVRRKLQTVARNMALADTPEQRAATAAVFQDLKAEETRLERRIGQATPTPSAATPEKEVERALAALDRVTELADGPGADMAAVGELFRQTNAMQLYLRFREVERGRRRFNVPAGGVLTFGSTPPPGPLYEGPTDRVIIRKMLASGESVSPVPGHGAPGVSDSGQEVRGSANVQRGT